MDIRESIGTNFVNFNKKSDSIDLIRYINLKLATMGYAYFIKDVYTEDHLRPNGNLRDYKIERSLSFSQQHVHSGYLSEVEFLELADNIIQDYQEKTRLLSNHRNAVDRRINDFLVDYFSDGSSPFFLEVPHNTFILDQYGLAREISLPPDQNTFKNTYIESYRVQQGILHNPSSDKRSTEGSFHIVEGGAPLPIEKIEVPKTTFAHLFYEAVHPPKELLTLPFTSTLPEQAELFVSLLLRPIVCPEVPGYHPAKSMEIRFFVPGSCVSTLDFVESVFGNAGDPNLNRNDAGLDIKHWTGHTGCVILAPHLVHLKKKDLMLPHWNQATERQRRDGMCYKDADECYNDGNSFKVTCRNLTGQIITLIADNYFGYAKKEIKTQISYSANLYGLVEEEHAGGAIAFPRKNHGEFFSGKGYSKNHPEHTFEEVKEMYASIMTIKPENYAVDKMYPQIIYIPEEAEFNLYKGTITWDYLQNEQQIKILRDHTYIFPNGYKIHMEKHPEGPTWRLIGTQREGTFCHKPCTVSGGGKSEISKSLQNAIIYDSFYINSMQEDFDLAEKVINFDFRRRWKEEPNRIRPSRPLLYPERTLGSVIKLLTPSPKHTAEYIDFLNTIPIRVKSLVLFIKMVYRPEWGEDWRKYFSVDLINGREGHSLLFKDRKIIASYLRVGFYSKRSWYVHRLRTDFIPAAKIHMEDDISATITVPRSMIEYPGPESSNASLKIVANCEYRFFQRPDEAIHRGYDKEAEADLAKDNNFVTNYEPLTPRHAKKLIENAIEFEEYTEPMQKMIKAGAASDEGSYFMSPTHTRVVGKERSTNPRYLQIRPDFVRPMDYYIAEIGTRIHRKIPLDKPVVFHVDAVLPGRRNNPPDKNKGIRSLSVYNPIHYQELPELFMDYISSLTGKSPSTTGVGSEGALTKGPFNMLVPTTDLNNALLSYILTGYNGFSSAAGHIGTENRFDHDISILMPELWCRVHPVDRDPKRMIEEGLLEKLDDFEYNGSTVLVSRLGYRITKYFLIQELGKVFSEPLVVFTDKMLRPELQDMDAFVDGVNNIVETQKRIAQRYFDQGCIESLIPPLQALIHIMVDNHYKGKKVEDPEIRAMFTREYVLQSDWYYDRLSYKQQIERNHLEKRIDYIKTFMSQHINQSISMRLRLQQRLEYGYNQLEYINSESYLKDLVGTIGADRMFLEHDDFCSHRGGQHESGTIT